jgi:hypothetical protein
MPRARNEKLSCEVTENCIYIYDEELALEFLDYILSKVVEPYEKVPNKLIGLINEEACTRKERLVEARARSEH